MRFRHGSREEPEINLIPFIDVLLVILIFLMLTTTYNKFTELQLTLPTADAQAMKDRPREVVVTVGADGRYMVNRQPLQGRSVTELASAMGIAVQSLGEGKPPVLIISADAQTPHQAVVTVMEAARNRGLAHITFATQSSGKSN